MPHPHDEENHNSSHVYPKILILILWLLWPKLNCLYAKDLDARDIIIMKINVKKMLNFNFMSRASKSKTYIQLSLGHRSHRIKIRYTCDEL